VLAGEYLKRTGDKEFIKEIWPNIQRALTWIEDYAEDKNWPGKNPDGFVVYQRKAETGLENQMWKDSKTSVFYENGDTNVKFPRAVCEVQGYAYAAWKTGKTLAELFHEAAKAKHYSTKADNLYENFNEKFWDKKDGFYVLALDGDKRQCRVKASNMGQLLFTGIVPEERQDKVVSQLMDKKFFSGFGVRTIEEGEALHNPLSYHNGTIWPHDNALIASGFGKTGHTEEALAIFKGMMAAAEKNGWRLPELFSGFPKEEGFGPTRHPHACSPQAWAAAAPFQLLQAVLGLEVDAGRKEIRVNPTHWQSDWGTLKIEGLAVGDQKVSFKISSAGLNVIHGGDISFIITGSRKSPGLARKSASGPS
jgi:pentatricopeptide repeat protein